MARKRRVPEVLWRLFNSRARTLADTIISLIPPTTPSAAAACRCKGRGCLGCTGDGAISFLLRPDDPSDYRKLLYQCIVVVSDNAPPFSAFYPDRRWSQQEVSPNPSVYYWSYTVALNWLSSVIVKRTIEMIISEQPLSSNVLCSDYDKHCCSSSAMELLTSSAWDFLLRRVGDGVMVYLLKYTSIFLPLPRKKHYQVAGFPISDFCLKSKHISEPKCLHSSFAVGSGKKRKGVYEVDLLSEKDRHCRKKRYQKSSSGRPTLQTRTANCNTEGSPNEEHHGSSNQLIVKPGKRQRQFSWQRHRKRRKFDIQETHSLIQCARNASDGDSSYEKPHSGFNTSMPFQCSCCLFLQKIQYISREGHIDRQSIFYRSECSASVLPRNHVLNSLRPNASGAKVLFEDIFGLSDGNINSLSRSCYHSSNCCLTNYKCLYHSLVKFLKNLIRKAHRCQHLRLLEKHCPIPSLDQSAEGGIGSIVEGIDFQANFPGKRHAKVQQDGKLPPDNLTNTDSNICGITPDVLDHQFEPSQSYCLKKHVVSFLWAVCRSIVPPDLLGTSSNWRILRKSISRFVRLRRFEKFSLKQCMYKLKTSVFPFLSDKRASCYSNVKMLKSRKRQIPDLHKRQSQVEFATHSIKHKIVQNWILWFFSCLIVPLVQANFYVTESEHGKQNLFYYRKSVWENIMNKAIISLKNRNYHPLNDESVWNITNKRSFGFSRVRLRPKENGVRVLANLKASSRILGKEFSFKVQPNRLVGKLSLDPKEVKYDYFRSVNSVLRDLHAVLKGLQLKEPENLGSSVFDYNDVYTKLCPFLSALKNGSTKVPEVFIVVSDVSKAFDSVKQDKLISVMEEIMQSDEYLIKKSHQVVCANKSLWAHQNLILADQDTSIGSTIFTSFASRCSLQGILVNQGQSKNTRKEELFFDLNEHVKHNVLQLDKHFYLQDVGIPQGSVLSSLLCSFYYGHLETKVIIPFLQKSVEPGNDKFSATENRNHVYSLPNNEAGVIVSSPKYMLLRFIDDFIFISTSKKQAASFFSRLRRGFREYNCYMNEAKFGLNFDADQVSGLASNRVYMGPDGVPFLGWSGLFINCRTLEVQADYTRYLNMHLSSSLTVCWQGKPGGHLKAKLCDYLRPKCHPIFFDSNINSSAVVRLNIYQAFLLCAMKFHCYVCDLSNICKLDLKSYMCSIEKSLRYMHKLVKKRMHSVDLGSSFHPIFQVERGEFEWLGLVAYTQVLKRKQSRYRDLLSLLRSKLIAHEEIESVSSVLRYAVDDSHSSVIWKIRY
ncbi:telomerase reverse transcriptase isoform X3 [Rhododendron vialii]|uniref:telomerase reverse transcriptase isoform X3 n=1 Tax=Rhododendron vialii TaxID=182163 RepID=UPI00265E1FCD|nr:telomerase reverse transcriptase isoform X3 [Rhododendron vialii]